jgi:hypothetical protein
MKESTLQQLVCNHLSLHRVFYFSIPNERYGSNQKNLGLLKKMGFTSGMPDLAILANGTIYFMEFKIGNKQPTDQQKLIIGTLLTKKYKVTVIRTFAEAEEQLKIWGIV